MKFFHNLKKTKNIIVQHNLLEIKKKTILTKKKKLFAQKNWEKWLKKNYFFQIWGYVNC